MSERDLPGVVGSGNGRVTRGGGITEQGIVEHSMVWYGIVWYIYRYPFTWPSASRCTCGS